MQAIQNYINNLNVQYRTGRAREHTYRGYLQNLLEEILPEILVTNEPAHIACGAPDYILTKNKYPRWLYRSQRHRQSTQQQRI